MPCSTVLDTVRPQILHALNASCGVDADLVEITLEHHNETEPCPALLRIFHLLDQDSIALSTIKDCLERKDPLSILGVTAGQFYLNNAVPVTMIEQIAIPIASIIVLCMAARVMYRRVFRWRFITNFLSYRVDSDQELVEELHKRLVALGLSVWWDKKCLKPGQPWEDGFADGLFGSKILIPVLSKGALANFSSLTADSSCDNVLLEHALALEQRERGIIKAIFPVFVGEVEPTTGQHGNFFRDHGIPGCSREAAVTAVDAKVREHLERKHRDNTLMVTNRTPKGVLDQLCRCQGDFVQGDHEEALDRIALAILAMNKDVAAGKVIAVATEGGGSKDDAPSAKDGATRDVPRDFLSWLLQILRLRDDESGSSCLPDTNDVNVLLPGTARSEGFERFFSAPVDGESSADETANPVLAHEAKTQRILRESTAKGKSGQLRRLMPSTGAKIMSEEEEIEAFLKHQGVKSDSNAQMSPGSKMAVGLQKAQFSRRQLQDIMEKDRSHLSRARRTPKREGEPDRESQQSSARNGTMPTLTSVLKSVRSRRLSARLSARLSIRARVGVPDGAWSADSNADVGAGERGTDVEAASAQV